MRPLVRLAPAPLTAAPLTAAPLTAAPLTAALLTGLTLLASLPIPAHSQALETARGEILIRSAGGKALVQTANGSRVELPLTATARVSDLRTSSSGWLAAAVASDGDAPALHLFRGRGEDVESLPSPVKAASRELQQPTFLVGGDLEGLAWLAGDAHHQLAVTFSRWLGGSWSEPEIVSPPGKGTQIALSTAVLGDGSWLLAWAAFDGTDDEILWSRWSDGAWSASRPVAEDNAVPDITPHLVTTGDGALLAWSRYDGNDYRVNVARFAGDAFSAPTVVGPKGSTAPAFSATGAGGPELPYLIYHVAVPRAWAVAQLDPRGKVIREAAIELDEPRRPILARAAEGAQVFEWFSGEAHKVSAPLAWTERAGARR